MGPHAAAPGQPPRLKNLHGQHMNSGRSSGGPHGAPTSLSNTDHANTDHAYVPIATSPAAVDIILLLCVTSLASLTDARAKPGSCELLSTGSCTAVVSGMV